MFQISSSNQCFEHFFEPYRKTGPYLLISIPAVAKFRYTFMYAQIDFVWLKIL